MICTQFILTRHLRRVLEGEMQRRKGSGSATAARRGSRWSPDEAQQILDEWATSGESLNAFAKGRGLAPQRLCWWQKRLGGQQRRRSAAGAAIATAPAFLPVTMRLVEREPISAMVEIADRLRVELRMLDGGSAAWVAALVKALRDAS
jgi:hypothetical protein